MRAAKQASESECSSADDAQAQDGKIAVSNEQLELGCAVIGEGEAET